MGWLALLTIIAYCFIAAFRDESIGTDTARYIDRFYDARGNFSFVREIEPGFDFITLLLSLQPNHGIYLLFWLAVTSFFLFNIHTHGLNRNFALFLFISMCYPFFYGMTLNVIRQGVGFSLIFSYLLIHRKRFWFSFAAMLVAASIHYASLIFSILIIASRNAKFELTLGFWLLGLSIGILGPADMVGSVVNVLFPEVGYYSSYFLENSSDYKTGFRFDFILYSLIGTLASVYIFYFRRRCRNDIVMGELSFETLAKAYLAMNGFALIFLRLPYADRYLSWSWYLYPIFVLYLIRQFYKFSTLSLTFVFMIGSWVMIYFNLSGNWW